MALSTGDLGVLCSAASELVVGALRLAHEVHALALAVVPSDRPIRVVEADRRIDREPGRQLYEEPHALVVIETLREFALD